MNLERKFNRSYKYEDHKKIWVVKWHCLLVIA